MTGRTTSLPSYRGTVLRWLSALVVVGIVSGFTFLLLTGDYINDGPVLVIVTRYHGLHAGDLFVLAGWAVAIAALALLIRKPGGVRAP